jgi:alpha-L-fucosidase
MHHPMRDNPRWKDAIHDWDRYLDFMHGQVKELVSEYGRIDILWLDFSYGDMRGEKWKARDLVKMIRHYQPDIILNNRLSGDGASSLTDGSSLGDFDTPEQGIPDAPRVDHLGRQIPWEACLTMNNSWGYNLADKEWKSPALIVHALVNCAGKNGNLLLNVGPDSGGNIPGESVRILQQVGEWMKQNGRSIYECGSAELPKPDWGMFTQNGKLLYAHLMYPHIGHINLKGYADKVKTVRLLKDGSEAPTVTSWWGDSSTGNFFINVKAPTYLTYRMPDEIDTVFEIELK